MSYRREQGQVQPLEKKTLQCLLVYILLSLSMRLIFICMETCIGEVFLTVPESHTMRIHPNKPSGVVWKPGRWLWLAGTSIWDWAPG